jgi:hypothetical protein
MPNRLNLKERLKRSNTPTAISRRIQSSKSFTYLKRSYSSISRPRSHDPYIRMAIFLLGGGLVFSTLIYRAISDNRPYRRDLFIDSAPVQELITGQSAWTVGDHKIFPLARFSLHGRVLRAERYRWSEQAKLAPIDLSVSWGQLSRAEILEQISISTAFRSVRCRPRGDTYPLPFPEVISSMTNLHLIPASEEIKDLLFDVERDDEVKISGTLVEVQSDAFETWRSSLSRDDLGTGAWEIVWVEKFSIVSRAP